MPTTLLLTSDRARDRQRERYRRSLHAFVRDAWPHVESRPFVDGRHLHVLCEALEAFADQTGDLVVNVPPGTAKPVYTGCMVLERLRGRVALKEIRIGDEVLTHRGRFRRVLAVHEQGILPTLTLVTASGRELRLALDHPVLTCRGWIEAQHVTLDDVLAEVHGTERAGTATVTPEEARLLGYIVGDGSCSSKQLRVTNCDPAVLADVEACAASLGFATRRKQKEPRPASPGTQTFDVIITPGLPSTPGPGRAKMRRAQGTRAVRWFEKTRGPHPVWAWLEKHGLRGATSYTKLVPAAIFAALPDLVAEFLGAYWSCDGSVSKKDGAKARDGTRKMRAAIDCSSVSRELARGLQHLLCRLGIRARLRRKVSALKSKKQGALYTSWALSIATMDGCSKFAERIPIRHAKGELLSQYRVRTDYDHVLNADRVIEIRQEKPAECRCLTVEDDHSFVVEDIAVHNSWICSVLWPCWVWATREPGHRFLCTSYSDATARRDAIRARNLLSTDWWRSLWPEISIPWQNTHAASDWSTTSGGGRISVPAGGQITGRHADTLIADDPIKPADAHHERAELATIQTWWDETVPPRVLPGGRRLIVMQRLHESDLSGVAMSRGARSLVLPMRFESARADPRDWRTVDGELLWPEAMPADVVDARESAMSPYAVAGQEQQRPAPEGGGIFQAEWLLPRWETLPSARGGRWIQSWDCAFKGTAASDYVVGQVWCAHDGYYDLVHQVRGRWSFSETLAQVIAVSASYPWARTKLVEDKANGPAVMDVLRSKLDGLTPVEPQGGKEARAHAVSHLFRALQVRLHPRQPWVMDYLSEFATFPHGANDDQVDATSQALTFLCSNDYSRTLAAAERLQGNPFFGMD
jgi:predicted phage terminase large subunit-like protein